MFGLKGNTFAGAYWEINTAVMILSILMIVDDDDIDWMHNGGFEIDIICNITLSSK